MRIAVCSDEAYPVHHTIARELERRGHTLSVFGAFGGGGERPWAEVAEQAAGAIVDGQCEEGVFLCWSGTGICMAANKLPGIRAALCHDAGAVRAARVWNHANVLCLSNRTLSDDMAKELLEVWFEAFDQTRGSAGVKRLEAVDERWRSSRAGSSDRG